MSDERPTDLRTTTPQTGLGGPSPLPPAQSNVNEMAELIADLLEPTGLVPRDRLAALRGNIGAGSFAEALRREGLAPDDGVARALAARYRLPFIHILAEEIAQEAV